MADRHWVGGTDTWNATAGTKWSLTEGGAGGQAIPTGSDDVFFNAGSGAVTCTTSGARLCLSLDCTGFAGALTMGGGITVSGSLKLVAGMTFTPALLTFNATSTGKTVESGGKSFTALTFSGVGGGWAFQDALTLTSAITITNGALATGGVAISCTGILSNNSNTRGLTLGASSITLSAVGNVWNTATTTGLTFDAGTSTLKVISTSGTPAFSGGGLTFNNYWNATTATAIVVISGSNTFNDIKIDAGRTQRFTAGTTQTITSLTVPDDASNGITLESTSAGTAWDIVCASGTITVKGCTIIDSHASGGATFNAFTTDGNVDGGGNTGWTFTDPAASAHGGFLLLGVG
jgi:hypothetical protein